MTLIEDKKKRVNKLTFYCLVSIILLLKIKFILMFGSAVPYWDQWDSEAAFLMIPFLENSLNLSDLFASHNEHRIFFTRILSLFLLKINSHWDPVVQMIVNSLLAGIPYLIIYKFVKIEDRYFKNIILGFMIFSYLQPSSLENTLAGFQSQFYLMVTFSLLSIKFLCVKEQNYLNTILGLLLGVCACFSMASGVLSFAVVICYYMIQLFIDKKIKVLPILNIVLCFILFFVFYKYTNRPVGHEGLKAKTLVDFLLTLKNNLSWPGIKYELIILHIPLFYCLINYIVKEKLRELKPIILIGFFVVFQAVAMSYSRVSVNQYPASRYQDILIIGLIANLILLVSIRSLLTKKFVSFFGLFSLIWFSLTCLSFMTLYKTQTLPLLKHKIHTAKEQLERSSEYIKTGNLNVLKERSQLEGIPYPSPERLALLLSNESLRKVLPSVMKLKLNVLNIKDNSDFVQNGYYPTTPFFNTGLAFGSYNQTGDKNKGEGFSERIEPEHQYMVIPHAGYYFGKENLQIEIHYDNGEIEKVNKPKEPVRESWGLLYVKVKKEAFKFKLIDNSNEKWFAIGNPHFVGPLTYYITILGSMHLNKLLFLLLVILLLPYLRNYIKRYSSLSV